MFCTLHSVLVHMFLVCMTGFVFSVCFYSKYKHPLPNWLYVSSYCCEQVQAADTVAWFHAALLFCSSSPTSNVVMLLLRLNVIAKIKRVCTTTSSSGTLLSAAKSHVSGHGCHGSVSDSSTCMHTCYQTTPTTISQTGQGHLQGQCHLALALAALVFISHAVFWCKISWIGPWPATAHLHLLQTFGYIAVHARTLAKTHLSKWSWSCA